MPIAAPQRYAFDVERGDDRGSTGHDVAADDHGAGAERLRHAVGDERGQCAADRAGREQQPEPRVASVEDVQREQHERRFDRGGAEIRDRTEPGQAAQHGVVAQKVPSSGQVLAHGRADPLVGTHALGAELPAHRSDECRRDHERERVDSERHPDGPREEQRAQRRSEQLLRRRLAGNEPAVRPLELRRRHDVGDQTGRGRIEQRLAAREHEDHEPHHWERAAAHRDGDREDRDDHRAQRVHADHDAAPVVAVRDNATEDTDEEEREARGRSASPRSGPASW